MMTEVGQLERQLQQEASRSASGGERSRQGSTVSGWWDQLNDWFKRRH